MTERSVADGATRLYGIIGDPIAQVRSPVVFNAPLTLLAREAGCGTMNGQAMVAGQADAILRFFGLLAP